jgi:pullulanase/glycogen debranching enzyme
VEGTYCQIDDPDGFKWSSPTHTPVLSKGLAAQSIYEMHIGTFSPEGTFQSAIKRLEHVASLGFTCIELMPITEFGGSWADLTKSLGECENAETTAARLRLRGTRSARELTWNISFL